MKTNWIEPIASTMHQAWMDFRVEHLGEVEGKEHKHFMSWNDLQNTEGGVEAMNQDRFVASLILLAFAQRRIADSATLVPLIHNGVQLWIRLTGEKLQAHHVPYLGSDDPAINEWMKKERTKQAGQVWPILQSIEKIEDIRNCAWIKTL